MKIFLRTVKPYRQEKICQGNCTAHGIKKNLQNFLRGKKVQHKSDAHLVRHQHDICDSRSTRGNGSLDSQDS